MGIEGESSQGDPGIYQISQRADFFSVVVSIDTMNRRPLINTRDEPHVDASRYRRFHVILGDSNMSEWATAMKIGTTALVLDLIERGEAPQLEIAQPVDANRSISRDQTCDWIIELKDGRKISAIDVQRIYLQRCEQAVARSARRRARMDFVRMGKRAERSRTRPDVNARSRRLVRQKVPVGCVAAGRETFLERSLAAIDRPRVSQSRSRPRVVPTNCCAKV